MRLEYGYNFIIEARINVENVSTEINTYDNFVSFIIKMKPNIIHKIISKNDK